MLGKIEFEDFEGLTSMPQAAASAWSALESLGICGAGYKPLVYIGRQMATGVNYWFICEQTRQTNPPVRHIVTLAINEFNGVYTIIPSSIQVLIA